MFVSHPYFINFYILSVLSTRLIKANTNAHFLCAKDDVNSVKQTLEHGIFQRNICSYTEKKIKVADM